MRRQKLPVSSISFCPKNKKVNILYVGAAEGHNIPLLVDMFPNTDWYLVDPRKDSENKSVFDKRLYKIDRVKSIVTNYFMDDIDTDMQLQLGWHKILKPNYSQLKFRIPYNKQNYECSRK
jgi:hypothetical protein